MPAESSSRKKTGNIGFMQIMELRDRIRALRIDKHLTQLELAMGIQVDQSTISYWEKGRQEPNAAQRKRLCEFLGITQSELFKGV